MKTIDELMKEIHENAIEHGWWENEKSFGEIIALCHSELSEALEEYRNNKPNLYFLCSEYPLVEKVCSFNDTGKYWDCRINPINNNRCGCVNRCSSLIKKPEGIAIELADCIIRILDYCGAKGIDIQKAIEIKHDYNKTRPYKHGGKKI